MAFEFEVEGKEDGLDVGKYSAEDGEPEIDQMRDYALVEDAAEGVVEG